MDKNTTGSPKVSLHLDTAPVEMTLREGAAIHPKEIAPKSINIFGTLSAPYNFLVGKPALAEEAENIHMLISNENGEITLVIKDQDPFTTHTITGKLTPFADLAKFKINEEARWTVRDFKKFIRTVKVYFADADEVGQLIESLNKWEAKIETIIKQHNNDSGNTLLMLEQKVSDVQLKRIFTLNIPLFKGYQKIKFDVEIGLDPKNTGVDLYLISDQLFEQKILQRETIMADEQAKFDQYSFSKVVVS